jgi:hypothetical protein
VNLSSEAMCFQRRQVPRPVVLLRCCTKPLVNGCHLQVQGEPTRLRRPDLLDRLLLGPTPPPAYWRCRLSFLSSSPYRTLLLGFGGPGDLDSRFGWDTDRTGEWSSSCGRPTQYTIGKRKAARHKEETKKKVVPATRPENIGNLVTSPLQGLHLEPARMVENGHRQTGCHDASGRP